MFPTRAACHARPTVKLSQTLKRHLAPAIYYWLRVVQAPPGIKTLTKFWGFWRWRAALSGSAERLYLQQPDDPNTLPPLVQPLRARKCKSAPKWDPTQTSRNSLIHIKELVFSGVPNRRRSGPLINGVYDLISRASIDFWKGPTSVLFHSIFRASTGEGAAVAALSA
jgi:hypothetical protein